MSEALVIEVSPALYRRLEKTIMDQALPLLMGCACCSNPNHVTEVNSRGHWVYKCKNCGSEC